MGCTGADVPAAPAMARHCIASAGHPPGEPYRYPRKLPAHCLQYLFDYLGRSS